MQDRLCVNLPKPSYREGREECEENAKKLCVAFALFAFFAVEKFLYFAMNQGSQP